MLKPWQLVALLEGTNSRLDKESIVLAAAKQNNDEFFAGCRFALDSMTTFGLKQIPEKKDADGPGLDWSDFVAVVDRLVDRTLTGNAARDAVTAMILEATGEQWNLWYRRILIKDLRCGVSEKTINKVVEKINGDYIIHTFSCQLAHDSANHEGKLSGRKLVEVKLDGVRVITIAWPDGRVLQFSRNGKELVNFEHVKEQLSAVAKGFNEPMVLDGEIMSSSFQDLMKQVHRKDNVAAGDAILNLFDYLTLRDFEAGGTGSAKQKYRSAMLQEWYETVQDQLPNVTVLSHEEINLDTEAGQNRFREINQQAIAGGYEGIMIKDPDAPYDCKRTASWLKLKPFIEVSLNVQALEEGTGRNVGRLGALVCSGSDDGKNITVNVGSGFSDSDRDIFWRDRDSVINQIVEVRADAITQNQDGTYSLRFPRFLRFRGFRAGEKI
jgi:DNA ligase-1